MSNPEKKGYFFWQRSPFPWRIFFVFLVWIALSLSTEPVHSSTPQNESIVLDPDGNPVRDAAIHLLNNNGARQCRNPLLGSERNFRSLRGGRKSTGESGGRVIYTGTDGKFRFPAEWNDSSAPALVTAEGFAPRVTILEARQSAQINLVEGQSLHLEIRTDRELPIENAGGTLVPLWICPPLLEAFSDSLTWKGKTGPNGFILMNNVSDGTYALRIEAEGRKSVLISPLLIGWGKNRYRVRLPAGRSLRGSIRFPADHPLSSGIVEASWDTGSDSSIGIKTKRNMPELLLEILQEDTGLPLTDFFLQIERKGVSGEEDPTNSPVETWYGRNPGDDIRLFPTENGSFRISAGPPQGGIFAHTTITPTENEPVIPLILKVPPLPSLKGVVISAPTGERISAAEIELYPEPGASRRVRAAQVSHSTDDGQFLIDGIAPGSYRLTVSALHHITETRNFNVKANSVPYDFFFLLESPGSIDGWVRGIPATGISEMTAQLTSPSAGNTEKTMVDENGGFHFDDLKPGIYDLYLHVNTDPLGTFRSMLSTRIEILAGETAFVEFSLEHPVELSGRVYKEYVPVPGAEISFQFYHPKERRTFSTRVVADADGHYQVGLPRPDDYSVSLSSPLEDGRETSDLLVEIKKEGSHRRDLHFSDGTIRGTVREADGSALEGVDAVLWIPSPKKTGTSGNVRLVPRTTEGDGSFRFSTLSPGEYRLEVRAEGFRNFSYGPFTLGEHQTYVIPDIILEKRSDLPVLVLDPDDRPLEGAEIIAKVNFAPDPPAPKPAVSNSNGIAWVETPMEGSFLLFGIFPTYPPAVSGPVEFSANAPSEPFSFRFYRGGSLRIQILGSDGFPRERIRPVLRDQAGNEVTNLYEWWSHRARVPFFTDGKGILHLSAVLPGQYRIGVGPPWKAEPMEVTVVEGAETPVVIFLESERNQ